MTKILWLGEKERRSGFISPLEVAVDAFTTLSHLTGIVKTGLDQACVMGQEVIVMDLNYRFRSVLNTDYEALN